jgi:cysteine desulfurase
VERIYLDHNATTPLDPRVLDAMLPALRDGFGNASSLHHFGQRARAVLEESRADVAALLGAPASEIVFTGSGTEADNLAVRGLALAAPAERRRVLYTSIEHHAVMNTAKALAAEGFDVEALRATPEGRLDLDDLESKLDERTALVAVMLANNETGVLQPLDRVVERARARGAFVHCDAVQAAGKVPVDVKSLDVDTLAVSAHKLNGPKGTGALWVRRGLKLAPLVRGGSQERNRRAGTENIAGIAGFGRAARLAREEGLLRAAEIAGRRDRLEKRLLGISGARVNGTEPRVPNTTNVSFEGCEAEGLLLALDLMGVAVSTGAACAAGTIEPSHVLRGMGLPLGRVQASLRFSLGPSNTDAEIERAADATAEAVERQRRR